MAMRHSVQVCERGVVVAFSGEVDLQESPRARQILLDHVARYPVVLVDLSEVDYIDSSGVASLVEALQAARKRRTGFGLAALSPAAHRVLQLGRLDRVFSIYDSADAGLDDLV